MKLFEYEAKEIARKLGLSVPHGVIVANAEKTSSSIADLKTPLVLKAQVLAAGRMKAGGVLFASSKDEAEALSKRLLGNRIRGESVSSILIEQKVAAINELYVGISVDRENRCYLLLASRYGGSDIEEVAAIYPSRIIRRSIDPLSGLSQNDAETIGRMLGYTEDRLQKLSVVFVRLYEMITNYDAELVEVNPLIETATGQYVLADLKIIIDDNSLFRHPEFSKRIDKVGELTNRELKAQRQGLAYVELDGNMGVVGNGAGLVMATLDLITEYGGSPADFCDVGGGADVKRVENALSILFENENVDVVLINILGGITRCDEVARGIVEARSRVGASKPLVVRMVGTFEEEGKKILREASIRYYETMEESVEETVRLARRI